ncbi:MAG TPA: FAD-dependent oxidoreductase, partial [Chloroflexi bacterium]|nr:FAD-dependent oxidoreductase [Chloroflexota bacterium]
MTGSEMLIVVGGGLAGSEAAWQAAERGVDVTLYEMRPQRMTPAHVSDRLAELVCSNSLGSDLPDRAAGLLKAELRRLGSLVLACADQARVPAGGALAVDRELFAAEVTRRIEAHPRIRLVRQEVVHLP